MVIKFSNKFSKKFVPISIILLLAVGYFIFSIVESKRWAKESKPYIENFLELLSNNNYEEIYHKYAKNSGMPIYKFTSKFVKLHETFGRVINYKFIQDTKAFNGKTLTSFYLIYLLEFDSGENFKGYFNIEIDKNMNLPKFGKIKGFNISGGIGKKDGFGIRLIK